MRLSREEGWRRDWAGNGLGEVDGSTQLRGSGRMADGRLQIGVSSSVVTADDGVMVRCANLETGLGRILLAKRRKRPNAVINTAGGSGQGHAGRIDEI